MIASLARSWSCSHFSTWTLVVAEYGRTTLPLSSRGVGLVSVPSTILRSLLYFNVAFVDISQTLYDSGLNSRSDLSCGHGIVKNLMRSALPVPVRLIVPVDPKIRSGCSGDPVAPFVPAVPVVPVVPVAAMPSGKKDVSPSSFV